MTRSSREVGQFAGLFAERIVQTSPFAAPSARMGCRECRRTTSELGMQSGYRNGGGFWGKKRWYWRTDGRYT